MEAIYILADEAMEETLSLQGDKGAVRRRWQSRAEGHRT